MNTTAQRIAEPDVEKLSPTIVRLERLLPGPVERVWDYLIDSDKRAKWFASGPMELRAEGEVTLTFRNSDLSGGLNSQGKTPENGRVDHVLRGVITRADPPKLLAFKWSTAPNASEVTFELTPQGADTLLVITHKRLENHPQLVGVSAGWHTHIGILIDLLAGEKPRHFWPEHGRLTGVYGAKFPG